MLSLCPPVTSMLTHFFAQMDACQQTVWEPSRFTKKIVTFPNSETLIKSPNVSA